MLHVVVMQAPAQSLAVGSLPAAAHRPPLLAVTWHIDNFLAFKDILETRKLFSKYVCHQLSCLGSFECSNAAAFCASEDAH